jgi:eukaryotic-like serine/threonine-protein kinase
MKAGDTINGEYLLGERLGRSPYGQTWTAKALGTCETAAPGTELVLKVIALAEAPDWKSLGLIENETAALKSMSHPAIPRYVDSFRLDGADSSGFVLVMERMPGQSLAAVADSGRRFTESGIETMFAELLGILAYIHSLRPPMIHRDVNPKNIILRPDGTLALVDFSGVQDAVLLAYRDTSTMMGTAGYAPLEQVSGRATVRSDLYAAAATAAYLVTRRHPSDLPVAGMRIDPGAVVELSPRLRFVLDAYLDPDESKRTLPPLEAAAILRGEAALPVAAGLPARAQESARTAADASAGVSRNTASGLAGVAERFAERIAGSLENHMRSAGADYEAYGAPEPEFGDSHSDGNGPTRVSRQPEELPSDSKVTLSSSSDLISLSIPRAGLRSPGFWFSGGFVIFWLGFVAFWTFSALAMGAPIFFAMFSLPFWAVGLFLVRVLLKPALSAVKLDITREGGLVFEETFVGKPRVRSWPLSDIGSCRVENAPVSQNGRHERDVVIETGSKTVRFGRSLSERERRAIASTIGTWLSQANI